MTGAPAFSILNEPSLARLTSIGLGGTAVAEVRIHRAEGLEQLQSLLRILGGRMAVLGRGTNIIAADTNLPLVLVTQDAEGEPKVVEEDAQGCSLRVSAGMRLPILLSYAARNGLSGLEGLAGIPGSVGGAVAGNAGSYGAEIGTAVQCVRVFAPNFGFMEKTAHECSFSYRKFRLAGMVGDFVITSVVLRFARGNTVEIEERMQGFLARKKAAQPVGARSAGCVFKNPAPEAPAGKLLDEAGLRGFVEGGMAFSEVHANFLVNLGGGTFAQAESLIRYARERVRERFGYELELEVQLWR